jgi:hypothetical protein
MVGIQVYLLGFKPDGWNRLIIEAYMGYSNADRTNSQCTEGQQERHTTTAQFADNRTRSAAQLQIQGMMHSSPQSIAQRKIQTSMQPSSVTQQQAIQCVEDEDLLQGKFATEPTAQLEEKPNNTGLPNQLKAGIESLSGMGMDHVNVHYNSDKPAQLNAHAYAQGSDIHVAPGQEKHLPHEAWHVVQQAQGRVKPTRQMKGDAPVNDDVGLEHEADVMGAKAMGIEEVQEVNQLPATTPLANQAKAIQCYTYGTGATRSVTVKGSGTKQRTFEECTYNFVEYKKNDAKVYGSVTSTPAAWATWLVNKKGGNNATQLHVVNARWGGKGGKDDKNIVPGSPAENSHHLHEAEKKFDEVCFGGSSGTKAIQDAKYECTATPKYSALEDVSGGAKDVGDPTLKVTITAGGTSTDYPVTDGVEGLILKQGD